ncbi:hypothetical protein MKX01_023310 [Papaver californicum]|nr:hypothetical protein MKX01_023310 [Papaver californicum]
MLCCAGTEEENYGPPANNQYTAPPKGGSQYGNDRGQQRNSQPTRVNGPPKILPIEIPALALEDLNKITNNFGQKSLVGEGSYGRVFYGQLHTGDAAAIKKLDASTSQEPDSDFASQLSTVSRLKHEHFVELLGYCLDANNRILAYQFATMGTLHDILHGRKGVQGAEPGPVLSWPQRVKIACGAARGLEYLHERIQPSIVHRDIRSSNVLLFDDFTAKIADFNLTNQSPDTAARLHSTRVLGTFGYHAPEYAMTGQLTLKSDVYSFGVVLLELLSGRKPVDHTMPKGQQSLVTWNSLGSKMKKSLRNFCNDDGSTSTLNQKIKPYHQHHLSNFMTTSPSNLSVTNNSPPFLLDNNSCNTFTTNTNNVASSSRSPTLEEMILQLEIEEAAARKAKLDEYGDYRRRMSCVNNSDVLRSARNALNQYPRFSLDGRDAMYRSNFRPGLGGFECRRKSVCGSSSSITNIIKVRGMSRICSDGFDIDFERNISLLPSTLAGESVIWCKPGVVAKLMGLDAIPKPVATKRIGRGKLCTSILRKENLRRAERQEMEKRRHVGMGTNNGYKRVHHRGRDPSCSGEGSSSTTAGYCEPMGTRKNHQTRHATPRLSEDKVKQCVDPKLNNDYPPKAIAKMAAVAALCVQYESDFRPNMTIVVKALQPLLASKPA